MTANRKQSRGACLYCGTQTTKSAMTRHLQSCAQRAEIIAQVDAGKIETLLHLRVQDAYDKNFWLDLEMRAEAPLKKLDHYLRAIWLECCGHMSEFSGGGWGSRKVGMTQQAAKAFSETEQLTHIYDFGTSSETLITLVGARQGGATTRHPIALMARNLMPQPSCQECEKTATHLCMECVIEEDKEGMLCDEHLRDHPHEDYGAPMPLVNSPRLGMCGYDGPAEPPY